MYCPAAKINFVNCLPVLSVPFINCECVERLLVTGTIVGVSVDNSLCDVISRWRTSASDEPWNGTSNWSESLNMEFSDVSFSDDVWFVPEFFQEYVVRVMTSLEDMVLCDWLFMSPSCSDWLGMTSLDDLLSTNWLVIIPMVDSGWLLMVSVVANVPFSWPSHTWIIKWKPANYITKVHKLLQVSVTAEMKDVCFACRTLDLAFIAWPTCVILVTNMRIVSWWECKKHDGRHSIIVIQIYWSCVHYVCAKYGLKSTPEFIARLFIDASGGGERL